MTLVEMLVVLTIIGIAAGAATLALGSTHRASGQGEAARLCAHLQLAADEAMASDRAMALSITPTGYALVERPDAARPWQGVNLAGSGDAYHLPAGMTVSTDAPSTIIPIDADGAGLPFSVTIGKGGQHWTVVFDGITARVASPEGYAG